MFCLISGILKEKCSQSCPDLCSPLPSPLLLPTPASHLPPEGWPSWDPQSPRCWQRSWAQGGCRAHWMAQHLFMSHGDQTRGPHVQSDQSKKRGWGRVTNTTGRQRTGWAWFCSAICWLLHNRHFMRKSYVNGHAGLRWNQLSSELHQQCLKDLVITGIYKA